MVLAKTLTPFISLECLVAFGGKLSLVFPLAFACFSVIVVISLAAARGRFHIPGYVGLAFLALAIGLLFGWISGARGVTGTIAGISLSVLFFLLMATVAGCVLALFFYRHPPGA